MHSLQPVFLAAAGVALVAFAISWLLPERPLREAAATSRGLDDGLAAPRAPDSLAEVERALTRTVPAEQRMRFGGKVAERAGIDVSPGATWALIRIGEHGLARARELAGQAGVPSERVATVVAELRDRGLIAGEDGAPELTPSGHTFAERAIDARRELLTEALADESAHRDPAVDELLRRLAKELAGAPPVVQLSPTSA